MTAEEEEEEEDADDDLHTHPFPDLPFPERGINWSIQERATYVERRWPTGASPQKNGFFSGVHYSRTPTHPKIGQNLSTPDDAPRFGGGGGGCGIWRISVAKKEMDTVFQKKILATFGVRRRRRQKLQL